MNGSRSRLIEVLTGSEPRVPTPQRGDPRLQRLSLNQKTVNHWSLRETIDACTRHGIPAVGVWREPLADVGVKTGAAWLRAAGLRVSSLCRGGFFTSADLDEQRVRHRDNASAIDDAAELGAACLVLVPGGLPPGDRDIDAARRRAVDAIAALVPRALDRGVRLGVEAMHPLFAADRGVVSTLAQALDIVEDFPREAVGVVVDTFHLWWEPGIATQLARASGRIVSYQVSDWITPFPGDALLSRGMMGDGHIDFAAFTSGLAQEFAGDIEVEILSQDVWDADGDDVLDTMTRRYVELIHPHLETS